MFGNKEFVVVLVMLLTALTVAEIYLNPEGTSIISSIGLILIALVVILYILKRRKDGDPLDSRNQ
ncbi:LPXTG-motif cell wall-anchored protein [Dyadobacter jejuensis]|uniref:LPXTG-motif cell wall-anchored protein n=1 Tax=Dyadobacter jejuensis TaxID=1082580 RepID=A0A316AFY1_9BACT|nr:LPXTG cell wall anchor domain-containing protein [Dyadobacter jejuensis]PWJ56613.1 LPXTG-motif cell wall-anchored protein [Dyadobacter jejuensis]